MKNHIYYNNMGIAKIIGKNDRFVKIQVIDSQMVVVTPHKELGRLTRPILSVREANKLITFITSPFDGLVEERTWNRRYRDNMEKIKLGDAFETAKVFRELSFLKNTQDLSFGERKMLDYSKRLLYDELSVVFDNSNRLKVLFQREEMI